MVAMRVQVTDLALSLDEPPDRLRVLAAARLGIAPEDVGPITIRRRAVDARLGRPRHVHTIEADVPLEPGDIAGMRGVSVAVEDRRPPLAPGRKPIRGQPVVVGAGPAGLFAAWRLSETGYRPILLERGRPVEARRYDTAAFWKRGELDPDSNVLFGEGGAGAFSDGKLTTRVKDPRRDDVLRALVACGAEETILYDARPHLGTDRLPRILQAMRRRLVEMGTEIRFGARVDDLVLSDGASPGVVGLLTNQGAVETNAAVFAIGHSARDTYAMLLRRGAAMEQKPFAIGVRVQHPQEVIDEAQYGRAAGMPGLGAAEYVLTCPVTRVGRAVYSFCMCPGGAVIPCATDAGAVSCNGMSGSRRKGRYANSAIVAQVSPRDYPGPDPLAGIEFQRRWESLAFDAAGGTYALPVMALSDLVRDRFARRGRVGLAVSSFPRAEIADLRPLLPGDVLAAIRQASRSFERPIPGWLGEEAVAFGVETRTSAPLRILRAGDGQSISLVGLFPAGEGAGYAGGIVSAAVDGLRAAEAIIRIHARPGEA